MKILSYIFFHFAFTTEALLADKSAIRRKIIIISSGHQEDLTVEFDKPIAQLWPCGDALDKRIARIAVPAALNLAVVPICGIVDTFWVGKMNDPLVLAGASAANQVETLHPN